MTESSGPETEASTRARTNGAPVPPVVAATVEKAGTTKSPLPGSELLYADAGNVDATTVTMDHSGAETVTAERATIEHSDVRSLAARSVQLINSGSLTIKAENAVLQRSSAGFIRADD